MADLTSFWRGIELIHDVVYFAPDARSRYGELGLKGYWMGYFASRAAAMGAPTPEVVTAAFHGFAPTMVRRALPDAWALTDRAAVLEERAAIARDALLLALATEAPSGWALRRLADALAAVTGGLDLAGKPLASAEASLPVPDDGAGSLWRRATVLREFRGDCHVAVLVSEGLGGAAANALAVATGRVPESQPEKRGWSDEQWAAARTDLRSRGWMGDDGLATISGRSTRDRIEDATDRSCQTNMTLEAVVAAQSLTAELRGLAVTIAASGLLPFPNPVGVARP